MKSSNDFALIPSRSCAKHFVLYAALPYYLYFNADEMEVKGT